MSLRKQKPSPADAEAIALQGLTFLATDPKRLVRFLSLTGTTPQDLKGWSGDRAMQSALLEYLLADESLLLQFASEAGVRPDDIAPAHALLVKLSGGAGEES